MRKKILIAEQSETIRNIAESLLRQNGYEVISVASSDKTKELIISSEPNMVIIGADLKDSDGSYIYELLAENTQTSAIPILIISDPDNRELSYPDEIILPRPFDPKDFINRVQLFAGQAGVEKEKETFTEVDPLNLSSVDDDFLDAALGIDNIDVESSEMLSNTTAIEKNRRRKERNIKEFGLGDAGDTKSEDDSSRVESLLIRENGEAESIKNKRKPPELSSSSKIEIQTDQYGMSIPEKSSPNVPAQEKKVHDYDWFVGEMQKGASDSIKDDNIKAAESNLHLGRKDNSEGLEPIKVTKGEEKAEKPEVDKPIISDAGVDKFITEFKKEMEQINSFNEEPAQAAGESSDSITSSEVDKPKESSPFGKPHITYKPDPEISQDPKYPEPETSEPVHSEMDISADKNKVESDHKDQEIQTEVPAPDTFDSGEAQQEFSNKLAEKLANCLAQSILKKLDKDELDRLIKETLPHIISSDK